jgi:hypothetical protein
MYGQTQRQVDRRTSGRTTYRFGEHKLTPGLNRIEGFKGELKDGQTRCRFSDPVVGRT